MGAIPRLLNVPKNFLYKKRSLCKNINKTRDSYPRGGKGGGQQRGGGAGGQQRGIDFYFKSEKSGSGMKPLETVIFLRLDSRLVITITLF